MTTPELQLHLFKSKRQRGTRLPPALEFKLHCMVADMLCQWLSPGCRFNHIAGGELRTSATAGRLKRMGVQAGWPDLILLSPAGVVYFLELKRAKRGRLSAAQQDFADWCAGAGVAHVVVDRFDAAINQLKQWGALRASVSV